MWRNGLTRTLTASQTEKMTADPLGLLSFQAWKFLLVPCGLFRICPKVLICNLLRALWTWINTDKYKSTCFKMLFSLFCWFPSNGYYISPVASFIPHAWFLLAPLVMTTRVLRGSTLKPKLLRLQRMGVKWSKDTFRHEQSHVRFDPRFWKWFAQGSLFREGKEER